MSNVIPFAAPLHDWMEPHEAQIKPDGPRYQVTEVDGQYVLWGPPKPKQIFIGKDPPKHVILEIIE